MIASAHRFLGVGLYTTSEAAFYARLRTQTLSRWLFGDKRGEPALDPQLGRSGEKLVTFLDFVQALAVRSIRTAFDVPLPAIRQGVEFAKRQYGIDYPFATKHRTFLFGDLANAPHKAKVVINLGDEINKELVVASGHDAGNRLITEVAELFMLDLYFGDDRLAKQFSPIRIGSLEVRMDPHTHFGEPYLPSCGYSVRTLYDAYTIEGGTELAAKAYGVTQDEINLALKYYDHLKAPT